jgi:hypothetical protein
MFGVDSYTAGHGRLRGKILGLIPVADGSGREFDVSELVTWLCDAAMSAPSMLLVPATTWSPVDDASFDLTFTDAGTTVHARVRVDERGRLCDFSTEDRYATLPRGLTRARWTTPVNGWITVGGRELPAGGSAIWHLPEGEYCYARARVDPRTLEWNVAVR